MILWEPPEGFWDLPPYFLTNHRVLMDHAREAGLGVLSYEEQAENWPVAIARIRVIVQRWGIEFPAIPELDIEGVDVRPTSRRRHHPGLLTTLPPAPLQFPPHCHSPPPQASHMHTPYDGSDESANNMIINKLIIEQ